MVCVIKAHHKWSPKANNTSEENIWVSIRDTGLLSLLYKVAWYMREYNQPLLENGQKIWTEFTEK